MRRKASVEMRLRLATVLDPQSALSAAVSQGLSRHQTRLRSDTEGLQNPKMIHLHKFFRFMLSPFFVVDSTDKICVTDWDNSALIPSPDPNSKKKKKKWSESIFLILTQRFDHL